MNLEGNRSERSECPVCGSNNGFSEWSGDGWTMIRCGGCGLYYQNPRLTPEVLAELYQPVDRHVGRHITNKDYDPGQLPERAIGDYRDSLKALLRYRDSGSILDIGVSNGIFLYLAREAGFETVGTDIAEEMVKVCRENLGLDVRMGILEEICFSDASFDVVVARHVLKVGNKMRFFLRASR